MKFSSPYNHMYILKTILFPKTYSVQKTIVTISILLQSINEQCNYLQSVLGIFFHLTSVPEKVIEMLAHAGLSISLSSIHNAVKSLPPMLDRKEAVCALQTAFA
jgi:hypothetical protein